MQQVMSQNGPIAVDITAFQIAQACGSMKLQAMLEVIQAPRFPYHVLELLLTGAVPVGMAAEDLSTGHYDTWPCEGQGAKLPRTHPRWDATTEPALQIFNEDGSPIHPHIKTRKQFYLAIAKEVKENLAKVRAYPDRHTCHVPFRSGHKRGRGATKTRV
jgi:hypothetical protein